MLPAWQSVLPAWAHCVDYASCTEGCPEMMSLPRSEPKPVRVVSQNASLPRMRFRVSGLGFLFNLNPLSFQTA